MGQLSNLEAGFVVPAVIIAFISIYFGLLYAYERWWAGQKKNENLPVAKKDSASALGREN